MPPESPITQRMPQTKQELPVQPDHLLPEHTQPSPGRAGKSGSGPIVGIVIIVILLVFGGLYFWGAALNEQDSQPLPLIPGDTVNS